MRLAAYFNLRIPCVGVVGLLTASLAANLQAQEPSVTPLPAAIDTFPLPFTRIHAVRELTDGRLLVSDAFGLSVIDWRAGTRREIGREGDGPGQYRTAGDLWPLGRDSTLFTDSDTRRSFLVVGTRIVATHDATEPLNYHIGPHPFGIDRAGRRLGVAGGVAARHRYWRRVSGREPQRPESAYVILAHPKGSRVDTIATVALQTYVERERMPRNDSTGLPQRLSNPLAVDEQALLFPDGWIAITRLRPYRVDWIRPGGSNVTGVPIAVAPQSVDEHEQLAAIDRVYPHRSAPRPFLPEDFPPWPAAVPPIAQHRALLALPDGRLLVRRMPTARDLATRYDVVGRSGVHRGQLVLPRNARVMGFGRGVVYVATANDTDLEYLTKHPWK